MRLESPRLISDKCVVMFSELVDEVIRDTKRGSDLLQVVDLANSTIRECQVFHGAAFVRDLLEIIATTATANPYIFTKPVRWRKLQALQFAADASFPPLVAPGQIITGKTQYFYAASTYFSIFGAGDNAILNIAYYRYSRRFKYYTGLTGAERPAVYDREAETYSYDAAFDVSDTTRENARDLTAHWLLEDWYNMIKTGVAAKVFARAGDDSSKVAFATYKSQQNDLLMGEFTVATQAGQSGGMR